MSLSCNINTQAQPNHQQHHNSQHQSKKNNFLERNTFLTIPFQAFEAENVYLLPHQYDFKNRRYNTLSYKDSAVELTDLPILTPPLRVQRYDSSKSILYLIIDNEQFIQKFSKFQEYLISTFIKHKTTLTNPSTQHDVKVWLKKDNGYTQAQAQALVQSRNDFIFQLLLRENVLSIFVNQNMLIHTTSGKMKKVGDLVQGITIRCLLRIFNILLLSSGEMLDGEKNYFRIHHSVPSIWQVD